MAFQGSASALTKFMKRFMSGRDGSSGYSYDYDPTSQEYTQTGGPGMKKGGKVKMSTASKRADGCVTKGKTKGKMI